MLCVQPVGTYIKDAHLWNIHNSLDDHSVIIIARIIVIPGLAAMTTIVDVYAGVFWERLSLVFVDIPKKKGVYIDGHDGEDVRKYEYKTYIHSISKI